MKSFKQVLPLLATLMFTSVAVHANTTGLTIDMAVNDMSLPSEALMIKASYDWHKNPKITQYAPSGTILPSWWTANRPKWCYSSVTWYTAYEAQGNAATNSRVQVSKLRMYALSNKTRKWTLLDNVTAPATDLWKYPFNQAGDFKASGARAETSGGYSLRPVYPHFHHGYGRGVSIADPSDIRAVFIAMDFRLIVADPKKADDRSKARYVVDVGADYYPGKGSSWGVGWAPGIGNGRYLLAKNNWRAATLLVPNKALGATFDELRKNPPPVL